MHSLRLPLLLGFVCRQLALQIPPPTQASLNGAHFRIAYSLEVLLKSRACVSDLKLIVRRQRGWSGRRGRACQLEGSKKRRCWGGL